MKKTLLATSIAALSLTQTIAFADESQVMVVTAARAAQTIDDTLAYVSVITKEDIEDISLYLSTQSFCKD